MPPSNTPAPTDQQSIRKRAASERVIPAIPLALSRPRAAKPQPQAEPGPRVKTESLVQKGNAVVAQQPPQEQLLASNGEIRPLEVLAGNYASEAKEDAAKMQTIDTSGSNGSAPMSISNGATPELPATESMRPSTPPAAPQASAGANPPSSRKPADRFDMRQIRTELPPAFIPSAEQHTPRSAASSHSNRPPAFHPHAHPAHPSTSSIVFGGQQDSATSSPAPPHSAGSEFFPPPHPNFGTAQPPYFTPGGHAHHTSEPYGTRMFHPGYSHQATQWPPRSGYAPRGSQAPNVHPHAHMPFRYPRESYTPVDLQQLNGRASRSGSASRTSSAADQQGSWPVLQSPNGADGPSEGARNHVAEPKAAFTPQTHPRSSGYQPQMPIPHQYSHPYMSSTVENAEVLRSHILHQFLDPSLADCHIQVSDEVDTNQQQINGHKIVLSRSSHLLAHIESAESQATSSPHAHVQIHLKGQHMRTAPFMDALNYLYGGQLLQLDHGRPGSSAGEKIPSNMERMEYALQYIAVGVWLKVTAIASRGVDVAASLLHWDTIAAALAFAVDGGLNSIWTVEDGSEDRASTSSSDDSLGRQENSNSPTFDPYSTSLLQRIIDFTVHVFPPNFYLDASAPQLEACPRLPPLPLSHESRPSRSDPRLSQIRFGEMTAEDHQRPSFATTTISSVLLSLPFAILKYLLEHFDLCARLGPDTVASIMRQVVAEREVRRTKATKVRVSGKIDEGLDAPLVQNLSWEEFVEPSNQHRAGFRLARRKRDIDTPPSSGACSERNK